MVNGYAQTSEKIALSKLLGGRVLSIRADRVPRIFFDTPRPADAACPEFSSRLDDRPMGDARRAHPA
jgi:hypothetical protein